MVRQICAEHPDSRRIACGLPGSHVLYDGADEYWELPQLPGEPGGSNRLGFQMPQFMTQCRGYLARDTVVVFDPRRLDLAGRPYEYGSTITRVFRYLEPTRRGVALTEHIADGCILLFPRVRHGNYSARNWPYWKELSAVLARNNTCVVLGLRDTIEELPGAVNLFLELDERDVLDAIIALMQRASLAVVVDSAAAYLGPACGLKTLVISHMNHKLARANDVFGTPIYWLPYGWYTRTDTPVWTVVRAINEILNGHPSSSLMGWSQRDWVLSGANNKIWT